MIHYHAHRTITVVMETLTFSLASIITLAERLDEAARVAGAIAAVVIAIGAAIRTYYEIRIKRKELELKKQQQELNDQKIYHQAAINKRLTEQNGTNDIEVPNA